MTDKIQNVLFLCTGNSARSIMAECALNRWGRGRFRAYSAGSQPKGKVHPMTLRLLRDYNFKTDGLRSKGWDEFARPGAPELDFVFTVCDDAAGEVCPVWPGQPMSAHWGVEDPASVRGSEEVVLRAFADAFMVLNRRIALLTVLPFEKLDKLALNKELANIGRIKS